MVANTELKRVQPIGWRTGLGNLLGRENRAWWGSRRWLVQGILWSVVVNGFVAAMVAVLPVAADQTGGPMIGGVARVAFAVQLLLQIGILALAVGAIVLVQDVIIAERQLGVTEWLLSKPVSRPSYFLSKLLASGLGVLVILVGLQGVIGYGLVSVIGGEPFPLPGYLVGMAGWTAHTLFYLTLTLMMGVLTVDRKTLLGVSLGSLLGGMMISRLLGTYGLLTPWMLGDLLPAAVLGVALPVSIWVPIGVTATLSVVFVVVALARFERIEF